MSIIWYHVLKNPWNNTLLGIYPSLNFPCVLVFFICLSFTMCSLLNIGWYIYFFIPVFHSDSSTNSFWLFFFFFNPGKQCCIHHHLMVKRKPCNSTAFLVYTNACKHHKRLSWDWLSCSSYGGWIWHRFDLSTLMLVITSFFPPFEFKPMSGVSKTTKKGSASSS